MVVVQRRTRCKDRVISRIDKIFREKFLKKNHDMEDINVRIKELIDKKFNGNNSKFARKLNISEGNVRGYINNTEPKFSFFSRLFSELPEISYEWLLLGKGDMLLPSGEPHEPASGAAGEQPTGDKSGDKSPMLVADEPQGYYPTSPTEQVLRQLVSALERTIKDKEEIISLLKERQPKNP